MEVKSTAYTSLVRLVLDYASLAWYPTSSEDIMKLEKEQRQTAWFVYGNYSVRNPGCVTPMVNNLVWETLESRRKKVRSATLYKIRHEVVDMDTGDILRLNDAPEVSRDYTRLQPLSMCTRTPLFPRTIHDWNRLSAQVTNAHTIKEFSRPRTTAADSQKLKRQLCF